MGAAAGNKLATILFAVGCLFVALVLWPRFTNVARRRTASQSF